MPNVKINNDFSFEFKGKFVENGVTNYCIIEVDYSAELTIAAINSKLPYSFYRRYTGFTGWFKNTKWAETKEEFILRARDSCINAIEAYRAKIKSRQNEENNLQLEVDEIFNNA